MKTLKCHRKAVEVEAVMFKGGPKEASFIVRWILANGGRASYETVDMDTVQGLIGIKTSVGRIHACPGDYIILDREEFTVCKPGDFEWNYEIPLILNFPNRDMIEEAWDDGDGHTVDLEPTADTPWFVGTYAGQEVMYGMEHEGVLHCIVHASGGGLVSVIVGRELVENELGVVFSSVPEAKAYVQGLIAAK